MAIMQVTVATPRPGPDMKESGGRYGPPLRYHHANEMLWFFSGTERMRLPVAAKSALSTAGAATKIVGSPTPPQNPPDGIRVEQAQATEPGHELYRRGRSQYRFARTDPAMPSARQRN